ncbi:hypothetical protein QOL99_04535 [Deinococcus sp. MIMF12]|uniref:Uncharacterized protein n=1 Tax=Deinococcus rhizophilus TaxID=3049544 RepID=A0ABT7JED4_9DEIO|nr:hypothetical protein [Deinococcus rhizophilus]MDL2343416.1 hypothetical protein [Deinococcus rhizophilus]
MSILVNPDAFPQAIRAVYDLAKLLPGTPEEFSRLLVPHSHLPEDDRYRDGRDILKSALSEAKALGLIEDRDGTVTAAQTFPNDGAYLHALCRAVLSQEERFCQAAQWFLEQDAYRAPEANSFDDYQTRGLGIIEFIPNGTQFSNFQRWMRYLGLARDIGGAWMPDPTRALNNGWAAVTTTGEFAVADVYARWREALPALPPVTDTVMPGSVSSALKALTRAKRCVLLSHADAEKWTLTLPHGATMNVSHIKVTKVKA